MVIPHPLEGQAKHGHGGEVVQLSRRHPSGLAMPAGQTNVMLGQDPKQEGVDRPRDPLVFFRYRERGVPLDQLELVWRKSGFFLNELQGLGQRLPVHGPVDGRPAASIRPHQVAAPEQQQAAVGHQETGDDVAFGVHERPRCWIPGLVGRRSNGHETVSARNRPARKPTTSSSRRRQPRGASRCHRSGAARAPPRFRESPG